MAHKHSHFEPPRRRSYDGVDPDATYAAALALRAAQSILEHHRLTMLTFQGSGWDGHQIAAGAALRIAEFGDEIEHIEHLRHNGRQDRDAAYTPDELLQWEAQCAQEDVIARWAAAEARQTDDPQPAVFWAAHVDNVDVDADQARELAASYPAVQWPFHGLSPIEQLAADYTEVSAFISEFPNSPSTPIVSYVGAWPRWRWG